MSSDNLIKIKENLDFLNNIKNKIELLNKIKDNINELNKMKHNLERDINICINPILNMVKSKVAVVFILTCSAGFASVFGFLCKAYIYAKENQYDFYISNYNWQYTYKNGWHDYFTTLNVYDPSIYYDRVEKYSWNTLDKIPEYTLEQYHNCVNEVFKINDNLIQRSEKFIEEIGGNYISIYIRRGDKHIENEYVNIPNLIESIKIDNNTKIFIQTDDYYAVEEIEKLLPSNIIYTMTPKTNRGADTGKIIAMNLEDRRIHAEELFISIAVFLRASKMYTDNNSNIGRLHKIIGLDSVKLYPFNLSDENIPLATIIRPQFELIK